MGMIVGLYTWSIQLGEMVASLYIISRMVQELKHHAFYNRAYNHME